MFYLAEGLQKSLREIMELSICEFVLWMRHFRIHPSLPMVIRGVFLNLGDGEKDEDEDVIRNVHPSSFFR